MADHRATTETPTRSRTPRPASLRATSGADWTRCRRCGRWPPRRCSGRNFDDDDDERTRSAPATPNREDQTTTVTRALSPTRRLGGGLVEIPRVPEIDPLDGADDQSGGRRVEAVLLELRAARSAGRPADGEGAVGGLVPALRQPVFVPAAAGSRRHGRRPVRDQGLHRARRAGLGVSGVRPQRQRPAGGAQGSGAFRRRRGAGDRDGRAPVPRRGDPPGDRARSSTSSSTPTSTATRSATS